MKIFVLTIVAFSFFIIPVKAQLNAREAAALMQKGINLGNTLEPPLEGGWNNPPAQEYYFDMYKQAGFNTVRVPVRWDEHTADTGDYKIDASWLNRVEQIVDWAISRDLFIIINAHHEDWIKQNYTNAAYRARFDSIWSQIAVRFSNKSQKLVFEIINEPNGLTKEQNNELHAEILAIIRKTNPTRLVVIQGHNWGGSDELIAAAVPDDDYIIGSFHSYDPYTFGLQGTGTWGTPADYTTLHDKFQKVKKWSDSTNIPVLLGEFGSLKTCDYNSRMKHYRAYVEFAQECGFIACAWDDGGDFKIMDRANHKWDEVKDILIQTTSKAPKNINLTILQDTLIKLTWTNAVNDADSIYIEHRTSSTYTRIAALKSDTSIYIHTTNLQNIYHYYRVITHYNSGPDFYSQPQQIWLKARTYYLGAPILIPGTVEAENFDIGGEGFTYHDGSASNLGGALRTTEAVDIFNNNGNYYVSSVLPEEWMEYTVNVQQSGLYRVEFYVGAREKGGKFNLSVNGNPKDTLSAPSTGSAIVFSAVSDTILLDAGQQTLRFTVINTPYFSFDKIKFLQLSDPVSTSNIQELPFSIITRNHELEINLGNTSDLKQIQVIDLTGRLIFSLNNPRQIITISNLTRGIYILNTTYYSGSHANAKCSVW